MTNKNISTKKLKAIVFTDIVGFTNISAQNEQLALDLIDKQRDLLKPIVLKNHGEWLKEIGDGLLFSFDSSLDAVQCSIEIQDALKKIKDFKIRIGIHQGAAVVGNFGSDRRSDYTCIGPTVNMASRIESACEPGAIYVSGEVKSLLPESAVELAGDFQLKGIESNESLYRFNP